MQYIHVKAVRNKIREYNRQITKDRLRAIDKKVEILIVHACNQFNGHKRRIDADLINFFRV